MRKNPFFDDSVQTYDSGKVVCGGATVIRILSSVAIVCALLAPAIGTWRGDYFAMLTIFSFSLVAVLIAAAVAVDRCGLILNHVEWHAAKAKKLSTARPSDS